MSKAKKQKTNQNMCRLERDSGCTNGLQQCEKLFIIEDELSAKLENLKFQTPIEYVYNPLNYAKDLHKTFINKYFENSTKKVMFLGMNPGPWGMCQTGIVFGEKNCVKEWLEITGSVDKPKKEHPKKRVTGLECHRSEISGKRFWDFFRTLCGTPENFFRHSFLYNHCPLAFMEASGKNITPPEIKDNTIRKLLNDICDEALIRIVKEFNFEIIIGIGKFAEKSAIKALKTHGIVNVKVYSIPHPSPRNAKNHTNWEETTLAQLQDSNLLKYFTEEQGIESPYFTKK